MTCLLLCCGRTQEDVMRQPGMVMDACNPGTAEVEARRKEGKKEGERGIMRTCTQNRNLSNDELALGLGFSSPQNCNK